MLAIAAHGVAAQDLQQIGMRELAASRAMTAAHDSITEIVRVMRNKKLPYDSIVAGALIVRYSSKDLSAATRATLQNSANETWKRVQLGLGDEATRVASRLPIVVNDRTSAAGILLDQRWYTSRLAPHIIDLNLPNMPGRGRGFVEPISIAQAEGAMIDLIGSVASIDEPAALKVFVGDWLPAAGLTERNWNSAAVDLATTNASVTRDCFAGSVPRCKSALGLTKVSDPYTEWYSPEDWRAMVSGSLQYPAGSEGRRDAMHSCVDGHVLTECEWLVRERPSPMPLDMDVRRTVVGLALEIGGPKAYARLVAAQDKNASAILEATSGMPIDDFVAAWRARVLAATPANVRPRVLEATSLIAWALLFAFAAQRRRP
jgi:hypothetical protein